MAFKDRLKEARQNKGYTQEQLAEQVGIAKTTLTGYEKGNREPNMATISNLLRVLEVDANYLWQDETTFPFELTYDEMEHLVKKYRDLDLHGKKMVDFTLREEWERSTSLAEEAKIITPPVRIINYYYRLASAGTGQILFGMPPTKRIEIPDLPQYQKADYAIGVNGNSMKPIYNDGDMLLVEMANSIELGEIGIFSVDNECYVKKLGTDELISLNVEYSNIPLNETTHCMGRVIGKL